MDRYLQRNDRPAQTQKLLGQEVETDDGLEWRVKWGQRGAGVSGLLAMICWVAGQYIAAIVFAAIVFIFVGILYYKNVSFVIAKRLLRETKRGDYSRISSVQLEY